MSRYSIIPKLLFVFPCLVLSLSYAENQAPQPAIRARVISNQSSWLSPESTIDDGAVYMIRNAANTSLVWDVYYGNFTLGNHVQAYTANYSGAQKFYIHKKYSDNNGNVFSLSPLQQYDFSLSMTDYNSSKRAVLSNESFTNWQGFLNDKFIFEEAGDNRFIIKTGSSNFEKILAIDGGAYATGGSIVENTIPSYVPLSMKWELLKMDFLGLDVCYETTINGTNSNRFVFFPPAAGRYIIETQQYGTEPVNTYMTLKGDDDSSVLAVDDNSGEGQNARITYDFTSLTNYPIYVRGRYSSSSGRCYVTVRPDKPIYFASVLDESNRSSALIAKTQNLRSHGYFPHVHTNMGKADILDTDAGGTKKIDKEYFMFRGHGNSLLPNVWLKYGQDSDWFGWDHLPQFENCRFAMWISCHTAQNNPKWSNSTELTSMAYQSIANGAQYSLGFVDSILTSHGNDFSGILLDALMINSTIEMAVLSAVTNMYNSDPYYFGVSAPLHGWNTEILNPILYKYGDPLDPSCSLNGDGMTALRGNVEPSTYGLSTESGYTHKIDDAFDLTPSELEVCERYALSVIGEQEAIETDRVFSHDKLGNKHAFMISYDREKLDLRFYDLLSQMEIEERTFVDQFDFKIKEPSKEI